MKPLINIIVLSFLMVPMACKKDKSAPLSEPLTPIENGNGALQIEFEHVVDSLPLEFNKDYINPKGDTFRVNKFSYFISNIVVTKSDNTVYTEPNSYHLIKHSNAASMAVTLGNVPAGSYKAISFMLGVDSARNVSGAQTGDLDPAKSGDMFWSWNTGYIFFKLEGLSPKSGDTQKTLTYHIGGYGGAKKGQRMFNLSFGAATANVTPGSKPGVHLSVNVNEFLKSPTLVDVSAAGFYNHMSATSANNKIFADNYADMISFDHIHNP